MIEKILKKLNENLHSNLTKEEIRVLYEIDCFDNSELFKLRKNRGGEYEDLSKIFGEYAVAQDIDEIDENTICYIGELIIEDKLPTYNLRYVYGNVYIDYNFANLDNLEKVYGNIYICNIGHNNELDGLSNLYMQRILFVEDTIDFECIFDIKYVNYGELIELTNKDYNYVLSVISKEIISSNLFLNLPKSFYTKELIIQFLKYFYSEYELINVREMENAFKVIPEDLLDNEIIISILERNGENIKYAPQDLINKELILQFVRIVSFEQIKVALKYISSEYYNDMLYIDRKIDIAVLDVEENNNGIDTNNHKLYKAEYKQIPLNILLYESIFYLNNGNYNLTKEIYNLFMKEKEIKIKELYIYENYNKKVISKESEEKSAIEHIINIIPKEFLNNESLSKTKV